MIKKLFFFFMLIFFPYIGISQITDFELLMGKEKFQKMNTVEIDSELKNNNESLRYKNNILKIFPGSIYYFYKKVISPQFSSNCLYESSCSEYSKQLIYNFGFVKGLFLTTDRLTRCNEMSALDVPSYKNSSDDYKIHEDYSVYKWKSE